MFLKIFGSGTFCPKKTLIRNPVALQTNACCLTLSVQGRFVLEKNAKFYFLGWTVRPGI
jgi:hypothetical protein